MAASALATVENALKQPVSRKIILAKFTVGKFLPFWTIGVVYTSTWTTSIAWHVSSILQDGTALTSVAAASACNTSSGTYYWDRDNTQIYVNPTTAVTTVYSAVMTAKVAFHFSNYPKYFDGVYWEPRLLPGTTIKKKLALRFGKFGTVGSGSLSVDNTDGYLNDTEDLDWHNGRVEVKVGVDMV